jgi:soluble lytic murein transglycosylase
MKAQRLVLWGIFVAILVSIFKWDGLGKWMYPISYIQEIRMYSKQSEVDPYLVAAIIRVESNFRTGLISSKGAKGMMQLLPETADWVIHGIEMPTQKDYLQIPAVNIQLGTNYLKYLMTQFPNNEAVQLAAYNAGQGTVRKWLENGVWDGTLNQVERIPYPETRHYVKRVLFFKEQYRTVYVDTFSDARNPEMKNMDTNAQGLRTVSMP